MLEIWKYHSTHFIFLSEVQHISTCSNNVCPYAKEKKTFIHGQRTAKFHRSFLSHSMKKLLTKVWSTDSTYQIDFLVICWIWKKKTINQSTYCKWIRSDYKKHLETYPHKLEESKNKNMEIVTVTIWHVCLPCLLYQWEM